ncbi:MAG: tRNA (adenosine(37)-N6)-dimethylallyltransferase MiaA [Betaproteobacteria bacterium]
MGPTASGKSALSMKLARRLPIEIISVDSAQVYRDMNIGTAKPDAAERALVPHHLIDIVDPDGRYSAAQFARDAGAAISEIRARGRVPLLTGGTMLYFKALTHGLNNLPGADPAVRAELDARADRDGWAHLHAELAAVDPVTAARLQVADRQRIQRALEVFHLTGRPLSALLVPERAGTTVNFLTLALIPSDRTALHARIALRFDAMLGAGLVDEVRRLRENYSLVADLPSMRAVGYRQAWQFIDGVIDRGALRDQGIFATRQLAKRQLTWLRATPATVFDSLDPRCDAAAIDWIMGALQR